MWDPYERMRTVGKQDSNWREFSISPQVTGINLPERFS